MQISKLLTGTALTVISSGAAMAADLPGRAAAPSPAPAFVAASWAGAYVGVNAGFAKFGYDVVHQQTWGGDPYVFDSSVVDLDVTHSKMGALAGVTAGYNFQSGNIVYGLEADFGGFASSKVTSDLNEAHYVQAKAMATLRARLGVTSGASLFYATAGFAALQTKFGYVAGNDDYIGSKSDWKFSPVVGAGIEHQLGGGWSVKGEGLYVLGGKSKLTTINNNQEGQSKSFTNKTDALIIRAGVNYKIGGSSAPVIARY